ncbi:stalk domain-containing protein [Paenibacillus medicaginis]|uniref:Stalk domain-containing protein n=1 Tax=Paenibacillus medicaginis TaxID=1470560 RepID=A0ABV5C0N6_9BACL
MKKWTYLLSGVVIGAVVVTSGSAFADQVKSLMGQKVAGEYVVQVNGGKLADSAIVVDGKAHVPIRAVSDSLGAEVQVDGKTINITTSEVKLPSGSGDNALNNGSTGSAEVAVDDSISKLSETTLKNKKDSLQESIAVYEDSLGQYHRTLEAAEKSRKGALDAPSILETIDANIEQTRASIVEAETKLENYRAELEKVNAALGN